MAEELSEKRPEGDRPKAAGAYLPSVAPSSLPRSVPPPQPPPQPPAPAAETPAPVATPTPPAAPSTATYPASVPGLETTVPAHVPEDEPPGESPTDTRRRKRAKLGERLANATPATLRTRRARIEARIVEIARPIGEAGLGLEKLRQTKLVDIDRVLKKLDRVEDDAYELQKESKRPEGFLSRVGADLGKIADKLAARELTDKRDRLVGELGLALLAADRRVLDKRAPDVARFVAERLTEGREIEELFIQLRYVEDELDRRERDGLLLKEPKALEIVLEKTGEVMGDATDAATGKLKDLGKQAAKTAIKTGGKAIMGLASGALDLGRERLTDDDDDDRPRRRKTRRRDDDDADDADESSGDADARETRDVTERLRDLARLHADGILTDAEFARKKKELLDRL
jgi:hypothetical protein